MTNAFGKAKICSVIALWKLEKPIVRKAPLGAFRYLYRYICINNESLVVADKEYARNLLEISNESFAKSKLSFVLIIEESDTVWYNNMN